MSTLAVNARSIPKSKVIFATTLGSALEFYDFTIYGFFSIQIGTLFFPGAAQLNQFLLSIAVFGVGFVMRPLGGVVIGAYADRAGRKRAMVLTIMMMALSCAVIACAPTYAMIGTAAPLLVLAARMLQGFAAGGEFGPGTTLLVEYSTDKTRAFFASWNFAAGALGFILAAGVATLINATLSHDDVLAWGWRIPFLAGIVVAPAGVLIRRRLEETLTSTDMRRSKSGGGAVKAALTTHLRLTILGTLAELGGSISVFVTSFFLPSHAVRTLHLSPTSAMLSSVLAGVVMFIAAPAAGYLADRFSRKTVLVTARVTLMLSVYPAFLLLGAKPTALTLGAVSAYLGILVSSQIVPVLVMIPELFPKEVRATGIALTYVVSASFFGGFSPFIATWLVAATGNPVAPAWYVAGACLISLIPIIWLRDRTGAKLD
ncbi:MFS transporter [Paraburkholderia diazotrophica]|uniref:MFS transporter, MHS family, proline/betaine transporter n=1 Tax=Paraburkholderia diazotrophica TaxID=667676 RepID=A0A1H7EPI8_9BURK|nr:MFS transporter [Paraburkholderia diazotrophica]SEK13932.1 MFS transporter, MHS family, proline/betaine transporter [Paraburkholderia diazotrophica]